MKILKALGITVLIFGLAVSFCQGAFYTEGLAECLLVAPLIIFVSILIFIQIYQDLK